MNMPTLEGCTEIISCATWLLKIEYLHTYLHVDCRSTAPGSLHMFVIPPFKCPTLLRVFVTTL